MTTGIKNDSGKRQWWYIFPLYLGKASVRALKVRLILIDLTSVIFCLVYYLLFPRLHRYC